MDEQCNNISNNNLIYEGLCCYGRFSLIPYRKSHRSNVRTFMVISRRGSSHDKTYMYVSVYLIQKNMYEQNIKFSSNSIILVFVINQCVQCLRFKRVPYLFSIFIRVSLSNLFWGNGCLRYKIYGE